jgi:hypothetical protein
VFCASKHYFFPLQIIKRACFAALDASINNAFKVSTDPTIQGWHVGMTIQEILDQLSSIYSLPMLAVLELNDITFCSPYLAADAPKKLFCQIKDCAKITNLGCNPYYFRDIAGFLLFSM